MASYSIMVKWWNLVATCGYPQFPHRGTTPPHPSLIWPIYTPIHSSQYQDYIPIHSSQCQNSYLFFRGSRSKVMLPTPSWLQHHGIINFYSIIWVAILKPQVCGVRPGSIGDQGVKFICVVCLCKGQTWCSWWSHGVYCGRWGQQNLPQKESFTVALRCSNIQLPHHTTNWVE